MASYTPPVSAAGPQPMSPPMVGGPSRVAGVFPQQPPRRPLPMPTPAAPPPNGGPADQVAPDLTKLSRLEGFGQAYPNIAARMGQTQPAAPNAQMPPPAPTAAPGMGRPPFASRMGAAMPDSMAHLGVRAITDRG